MNRINLNDTVKVLLTNYGISILKEKHDRLNKFVEQNDGKGTDFHLTLDSRGYYKTQLWSLMADFGHIMYVGNQLPFRTMIIVDKEDN